MSNPLPTVTVQLTDALVAGLLLATNDFDEWASKDIGAETHVDILGKVSVVDVHIADYDDIGQYDLTDAHIIFRVYLRHASVSDPVYFKKTGYTSSYDGTAWTGPFKQVNPTSKVVYVYE